ncbi:MAG: fabD 1 [Gemmataceae bacterium]|nr:fabD 1 [Gemmataceae bacterium]
MSATLTAPQPRPATPTTGWDTEVVVVRGDDRARLRDRAVALAGFVERHPGIALADLAATLTAELAPGGARLAVVAASPADLVTKLRRAADRLADPTCRQVRDTGGVYFFAAPLADQGTVALLFPGEGAQYLNMLADLCGVFPEVEETFAWCDEIAANAGRPEASLRRMLHLPAGATPEDRTKAEAQLRQLGPSIFGVLVADQAIYRVLQNLQLPVSAIAGHSAGELAALLVSGAMRSQEQHGPRLAEIMEIMQRLEEETGGPDVALLAVGAGKAAVEEAATAVAGGSVVVAMDNCPHQCVAVGPTHLVAAVESALHERGVICERLPFRRPYHTPLFEPWMGAFRELFAGVPFEKPHTPVYCCSTGGKFPDDPDAARDLAVNHWVNPVEFTRMVETMYADGVRVFVEAGPRGNLSAFVEDILRGRAFAAIPANVSRKTGPTQINHLVAQLAAHHVPLNLAHLYAGRETRPVGWEQVSPSSLEREQAGAGGPTRQVPAPAPGPAAEPASPPPGESNKVVAVNAYLAVMEQFLDVQRAVMEAFLTGHAAPGALPELSLPGEAFLPGLFDETAEPAAPPGPDQAPAPPYCLVGQIERLDPGREVVFRRVMDEREDRYADDHTLGGRGVSRVDPGQNGLPILPMTFSLEAMAEAALLLVPGKVVVAFRNIRLYRWLPFDPDPTTLEVHAVVAAVDPETGTVEVKADVRDLGNSFLRDAANKVASEAVVVLADRYPDPPAPLPFRLTDEQACKSSVEDLRRNMFHGPLFQMIRSLGRTGREGIEGTLEVQPRDRWFRSTPDPRVAIDPVLVDAAMHILGAWHLEQPDWTGRILLPIGVNRIEFFGPIPPAGSHLLLRGHNEEETARQVRHGVELFAPDGRPWLRMTGAGYWRFYLPFGHVNFFGPKDQYFLSRVWPEAVPPQPAGAPPRRCYLLEPPADLKQPVLRAAGARVTMTPRELVEFGAWTGTDAGLNDWFFGRMLAKDAVRAVWAEKHGEAFFPADMETDLVDGRLVVRPRGAAPAEPFPPVAVAVADGTVAAVSGFARAVGIALVPVPKGGGADAERAARERAACLAVADALRLSADDCTAAAADPASGAAVVTLTPAARARYSELGGRVRVQTARQKNVVVATTLCETDGG